jgi:hypothetical protein
MHAGNSTPPPPPAQSLLPLIHTMLTYQPADTPLSLPAVPAACLPSSPPPNCPCRDPLGPVYPPSNSCIKFLKLSTNRGASVALGTAGTVQTFSAPGDSYLYAFKGCTGESTTPEYSPC